MLFLNPYLAVCLGLLTLWWRPATASSRRPLPVKHVYHVSAARIEILSRLPSGKPRSHSVSELRSSDTFLLRFSLSNPSDGEDSTRLSNKIKVTASPTSFTLLLRPSINFIHPQAKITYSYADPFTGREVLTSGFISPGNILAYTGYVLREAEVDAWSSEMQLAEEQPPEWPSSVDAPGVIGSVALLVHETHRMKAVDDLENLAFEGSFEAYGRLWHIKTMDSYIRTKHFADAEAGNRWGSHISGGLIAWVDGDSPWLNYPQGEPVGSPLVPTEESYKAIGPDFASFKSTPADPYPTTYDPEIKNHNSSLPSLTMQVRHNHPLQKRQSLNSDFSGPSSGSNFVESIGSTKGCPATQKVVYVGVAADCNYVARYGSQDAARLAILNNMNTVSSVYQKSLNVSLGIVELLMQNGTCPQQPPSDTTWNAACPETAGSGLSLGDRLSEFSKWRSNRGTGDGAGLWHLMTDCPNGEEVGVAWLGVLCKADAGQGVNGETTSGCGITSVTPNEWQVMAHELAHNFGAIHDCGAICSMTESCCPFSSSSCAPNSSYIMAATATTSISSFSPCSIGSICSQLEKGLDTSCLSDPDKQFTFRLQQCGNGILEPGEDCDPGMVASPCCQWGTCKFSPNAVCDPSNSTCCTSNCQYASPGTICRPVIDPICDVAESCTGKSGDCPPNSFAQNGLQCGAEGSGLACAAGKCTSRDEQCKKQDRALGLSEACDPAATMDCSVACKDPKSSSQCVILKTKFVDGSPCGCGGFCSQGNCVGGDKPGCGDNWREAPSGAL